MENASASGKHQACPQAQTSATQAVSCHGTQPRKPVRPLTRKVGGLRRQNCPQPRAGEKEDSSSRPLAAKRRKVDAESEKARQQKVDQEEAQKMRTLLAA